MTSFLSNLPFTVIEELEKKFSFNWYFISTTCPSKNLLKSIEKDLVKIKQMKARMIIELNTQKDHKSFIDGLHFFCMYEKTKLDLVEKCVKQLIKNQKEQRN
jgi:hypothetical protein